MRMNATHPGDHLAHDLLKITLARVTFGRRGRTGGRLGSVYQHLRTLTGSFARRD